MRYEIIEVGQECGEVEYQVSDVHPNGERTHSYDFQTLAEAEECLDELSTINNNNGETKMKKKLISFALLGLFGLTLMFTSTSAEARGWGSSCGDSCQTIEQVRENEGLDPNTGFAPEETKRGQSAAEKAKVTAEIERLHKEFRESGAKDLDELYPEFFNGKGGKTYAEREAEKCFEDTWYGRKEITCEDK